MEKIERSCDRGRFNESEIRAKVAESKRYWSSPDGIAERRRLDEANACRKPQPTRFPELAQRGTRPALVTGTTATSRESFAQLFDIIR